MFEQVLLLILNSLCWRVKGKVLVSAC